MIGTGVIKANKVKLRIGRKVYEKAVSITATFVQFDIELDKRNVDVHAYFLDPTGKTEYPAYYIYIYED